MFLFRLSEWKTRWHPKVQFSNGKHTMVVNYSKTGPFHNRPSFRPFKIRTCPDFRSLPYVDHRRSYLMLPFLNPDAVKWQVRIKNQNIKEGYIRTYSPALRRTELYLLRRLRHCRSMPFHMCPHEATKTVTLTKCLIPQKRYFI